MKRVDRRRSRALALALALGHVVACRDGATTQPPSPPPAALVGVPAGAPIATSPAPTAAPPPATPEPAVAAVAAPLRVDPAINDHYREHPRPSYWKARLERDGREVYAKRAEILRELDLRPGMAVADVGAGTGLFTLPFARAVGPSGQVYAVDLMPRFLEHIAAQADRAGLTNVTTVAADAASCGLAAASVDLIFISDAYHHIEAPSAYLGSLRRALRPTGELILIDFERIPGVSDAWVFDHVRAGKEVVIGELAAAGFEVVAAPAILDENYFLRLRVASER